MQTLSKEDHQTLDEPRQIQIRHDFEETNSTNLQNRDKSQQGAATVFPAMMSVMTQFVENS